MQDTTEAHPPLLESAISAPVLLLQRRHQPGRPKMTASWGEAATERGERGADHDPLLPQGGEAVGEAVAGVAGQAALPRQQLHVRLGVGRPGHGAAPPMGDGLGPDPPIYPGGGQSEWEQLSLGKIPPGKILPNS